MVYYDKYLIIKMINVGSVLVTPTHDKMAMSCYNHISYNFNDNNSRTFIN